MSAQHVHSEDQVRRMVARLRLEHCHTDVDNSCLAELELTAQSHGPKGQGRAELCRAISGYIGLRRATSGYVGLRRGKPGEVKRGRLGRARPG